MPARERESDLNYLRAIEKLAHQIVEEAATEGWLAFGDEGQEEAVPLHRAINRLATQLRMVHHDGDECVDHGDAEDVTPK